MRVAVVGARRRVGEVTFSSTLSSCFTSTSFSSSSFSSKVVEVEAVIGGVEEALTAWVAYVIKRNR